MSLTQHGGKRNYAQVFQTGLPHCCHVAHLCHTSTPKRTKKPPCAQQESQCARRLKERIARGGGLGDYMVSSSKGSGPYSFSPSLPITENRNSMNPPIYGTNPKKIHQPDFPISCNIRTRRATIGIKDIAPNMPIRAKIGVDGMDTNHVAQTVLP